MGFKMKFTQPEKQNPEVAAKDFCSEIRDIKGWLECQTHERENITKARMKLLLLRDKYNCNRGIGFCSRTVQLADRVSRKVLQIVNLNHEDWNNCRRGQHFRYLDVFLVEFEVELYRSRQTPEPPDNVVPFRT